MNEQYYIIRYVTRVYGTYKGTDYEGVRVVATRHHSGSDARAIGLDVFKAPGNIAEHMLPMNIPVELYFDNFGRLAHVVRIEDESE